MRVTAFNRYTGRQRDEACVGLDGQSPVQLRCRVPPSLASLPITIRLRPAAISLTMLDVVRQFIPVWQCDMTYVRTDSRSVTSPQRTCYGVMQQQHLRSDCSNQSKHSKDNINTSNKSFQKLHCLVARRVNWIQAVAKWKKLSSILTIFSWHINTQTWTTVTDTA